MTGHSFFPSLISGPFQSGLQIAFDFSIAACLIAAVASLLRGKRYVHDELHGEPALAATGLAATGLAAAGDVTPADIAPVAIPADVIEAEAGRQAGRPRVTVAEEIEESAERRLASPELATRYRKER